MDIIKFKGLCFGLNYLIKTPLQKLRKYLTPGIEIVLPSFYF